MEGIIFDIKRFAVHDGPGIRTTVFFKGCPLECAWCHNPESIESPPKTFDKKVQLNGHTHIIKEEIGYKISPEQLISEIEKERIFMEESDGGVTFSGGEPLSQADFLLECLKECKNAGFHTTADTSLYANWSTIEKLVPYTDLFLVDIKLMDDKLHQKYTNVSNQKILNNLTRLSQLTKNIRIRIPIIPTINDTKENVNSTIAYLSNIKASVLQVDILPFHNTASHKYRKFKRTNSFPNMSSMTKSEISWIKDEFELAGFVSAIGG